MSFVHSCVHSGPKKKKLNMLELPLDATNVAVYVTLITANR